MAANVPTSETGTATMGTKAARPLRKNISTTKITNNTAKTKVYPASFIDARMLLVRSMATLKSTAAGIEAFKLGNTSLMRATVSIMLAPASRLITTNTAGLPLSKPAVRMSSTPSDNCATSRMATAAPFWYLITTPA